MKKIFVDAGEFYTKVWVLDFSSKLNEWQYFGRTFFPTITCEVPEIPEVQKELDAQNHQQQIHYEYNDHFYQVGYDCMEKVNVDHLYNTNNISQQIQISRLILNKVIFDYTIDTEDVALFIVVDSVAKENLFKDIIHNHNTLFITKAYRGVDKRVIAKRVNIKFQLIWASDGISSLLKDKFDNLPQTLVVDIGHSSSKMYIIDPLNGLQHFRSLELGMFSYYKKMIKLFLEKEIENINYLWMIKQIELECEEIEIECNNLKVKHNFDISALTENFRWDLSKDLKAAIVDFITFYFSNNSKAIELLHITGGGAHLFGNIIKASLITSGYNLQSIYIEKSPMYDTLYGVVKKQTIVKG
ncbi:MAG: hypothetical protein HQK49_04580 [Oligoflexia bacterium]|nr:hypothetical protein [Oligoflexia bacterium]